ncbi:MAG: hypothetical protein ACJAUL_002700, partial [Paraglaciecola sp.]
GWLGWLEFIPLTAWVVCVSGIYAPDRLGGLRVWNLCP